MQKYVFSSKLETADWSNSTIIRGDAATEVARLEQQDGEGLLILGHGKPLFREGQVAGLTLAATKSYSKLVKITYELHY